MKSLRGIRKDSLCLASRSIALVVFFIWSTVACSQLQAEDPLQLLTASHAALGDNESNATIRFARQTGEWQLVAIDFYFAGNNVNLEPVERFNSIEKLDIFMRTDSDPTASLLGIASISKLLRLRELKMSAKDLANGIDLANTLSNSIESLELDGDSSAIDSIMARLSAFPHLKTLKIYGLVTNESFSRIHESKSIQSIEIGSEALTDDAMVALATLHDLRSLDIFWCAHISELGIKKLVPLTKLNDLAVYKVNDKCIAALELLPALEKLSCLFEGEQADLRRLQRLKTFELPEFEDSNTKQPVRILFPSTIQRISGSYQYLPVFADEPVPQVESVAMDNGADWENADMSWLLKLPNLRHLTLSRAIGADVEEIAGLENLRSLVLKSECSIYRDDSFLKLKRLSQLEVLESESPLITEKGLAVLENFANLERLSIHLTESSLAGLENILTLKRLRSIHLWLPPELRDDLDGMFKKLAALENLEEISIPGRVTDEGLKNLHSLKKLRRLDLSRNSGYTDVGLANLMSTMPSLQEVIK